jgi:hypothetical protein
VEEEVEAQIAMLLPVEVLAVEAAQAAHWEVLVVLELLGKDSLEVLELVLPLMELEVVVELVLLEIMEAVLLVVPVE